MPTTICLINQKGGCGKSSTCFHLAGALAAAAQRVLLLDMDPQGSLSQGFFGSAAVEDLEPQHTSAALFDETRLLLRPDQLAVPSVFENIALVPANQHLAAFNTPFPEQTGMRQQTIREFVQRCSHVDIVLIDCPPNLYRCSWTAMIASDFVIIPVPPEDFGTQGLRAVHQCIEHAQRLNPSLKLLGHLITRCDRRLLIHRAYAERLRRLYPAQVLETVIPEATAFKVSLARRSPVEFDQPQCAAAKAIRTLCSEVLLCGGRSAADPVVREVIG